MKIMSKTWKKDTDDLIDFDTENVEKKEMTLSSFNNNKFYLIYNEENLQLIDSLEKLIKKRKRERKRNYS